MRMSVPDDENPAQGPANPSGQLPEFMRPVVEMMMQGTPHARALGFELMDVQRGRAWGRAPFRDDLVGDAAAGVIAGGVVTALLDQLCGVAAMSAQTTPSSTATIDLRIDYMRAAAPGRAVLAQAHCYKITRSVAFVRAVAYDVDPEDPVANATAAFMIAANAGRKPGSNARPPRKLK
jgi:uncharacterized protein (TIGR00369 family)